MQNLVFLLILFFLTVWLIPDGHPKTIENEYILKLSNEKSLNPIGYFYQKNGGSKEILHTFKNGNLHVKLGKKELEFFMKNYGSSIKYIEPNYVYHTMSYPKEQWALNDDYGVHADAVWKITKGSKNVIVAVTDTGVDRNHYALKNNMWVNKGEIPGDGIDNDGNNFIDDYYGWDFANNDNDPMDFNMHGSHCSGIIAANSEQVIGIAPNVKIMALQFLTKEGRGSLDGALKAIEYAVDNHADIISASWGGSKYSEALKKAIEYAEKENILFVAASGNSFQNNDTKPSYPASYKVDNVISVGASTEQGTKAYFSNFGQKSVHLFAPGMDILSTVPGNKFKSLSGSSMSTPYVSGVAALILSEYPTSSYLEIKNRLMDGVQKLDAFKEISISGGVLNAAESLR